MPRKPRRARNTGVKPPFRLRKEARTLDFEWVNRLSEEDAYEYFKAIRFRRNDGQPFCPCCGSLRCYTIKTRPRWWSCGEKGCRKQFSVTSGTIFHSRKLPFLKLLKLMCKFLIGVKGMSALQLSIAIDAQYTDAMNSDILSTMASAPLSADAISAVLSFS